MSVGDVVNGTLKISISPKVMGGIIRCIDESAVRSLAMPCSGTDVGCAVRTMVRATHPAGLVKEPLTQATKLFQATVSSGPILYEVVESHFFSGSQACGLLMK